LTVSLSRYDQHRPDNFAELASGEVESFRTAGPTCEALSRVGAVNTTGTRFTEAAVQPRHSPLRFTNKPLICCRVRETGGDLDHAAILANIPPRRSFGRSGAGASRRHDGTEFSISSSAPRLLAERGTRFDEISKLCLPNMLVIRRSLKSSQGRDWVRRKSINNNLFPQIKMVRESLIQKKCSSNRPKKRWRLSRLRRDFPWPAIRWY
jgi:hypothetical protein